MNTYSYIYYVHDIAEGCIRPLEQGCRFIFPKCLQV